jgi:hypothetical protein
MWVKAAQQINGYAMCNAISREVRLNLDLRVSRPGGAFTRKVLDRVS